MSNNQAKTTLWPLIYGRSVAFFSRSWFWLTLLLFATALAFAPGLHGPFLLDDPPNVVLPLQAWLHGKIDWLDIVLGNHSGPLHRPVSMLSFLANATTTGLDAFPFKLTNLAIHLLCGVIIHALLRRLLQRDKHLAPYAPIAALAVTALWLLHPMQVSTVLYIVQRMAQLAALFMLLGLLAYVIGRQALLDGRRKTGLAWLFLAVPTATLLAMLSKENGALTPLLCGVIEWVYYQPDRNRTGTASKIWSVRTFFVLFLLLPALAGLYIYGLHPQRLLAGYHGRLFTLGERLLSEPRALTDYMAALLIPRDSMLGVYRDDFVVSHGLWTPPSTILAIAIIMALFVAAFLLRKKVPAFSAGIGLYFAGHAIESTVFPLELYFEHRNYLPSAGFFLAEVGIIAWVAHALLKRVDHPYAIKRLASLGCILIITALGLSCATQAHVWSSMPLIAARGARNHPNSMRAQLDHANMLQLQGRTKEAQSVFDHMATMSNPAARHVAAIDSVTLQCMTHGKASASDVERLDYFAGSRIQLAEMLAFENLGQYLRKHRCINIKPEQLANMIVHVVDAAPQPATLTQLWRSRFVASRLYLKAGQYNTAINQAARAWMTGSADTSVGLYLANLYFATGDKASGRLLLKATEQQIEPWDKRNQSLAAKISDEFINKGDGSN